MPLPLPEPVQHTCPTREARKGRKAVVPQDAREAEATREAKAGRHRSSGADGAPAQEEGVDQCPAVERQPRQAIVDDGSDVMHAETRPRPIPMVRVYCEDVVRGSVA